jgi:hypothetical protein
MPGNTDKASDAPLFNYALASADMRYIEIGERVIYLRKEPERGLVLRGEIPGCGPGCFVDLSQIFLEFPMSCEGCREQGIVEEAVTFFGGRLGTVLSSRIFPPGTREPADVRLPRIFDCVFNSLDIPFLLEKSSGRLHYILRYCPFCDKDEHAGFTRTMEMARLGFIALIESILHNVAQDWTLEKPTRKQISYPLLEVILSRR